MTLVTEATTEPLFCAGGERPLPGMSLQAWLAERLRARILNGEWTPGQAMPAESALAAHYGVALGTMREALRRLVDDGMIERIHGRGTFVRRALVGMSALRFFRFGGQALNEVPHSRIVERAVVEAPAEVAEALAMAPGAPVLRVRRLREVQGRPCLLERIWLPLPDYAVLVDDDPDAWGDLLYPMYAARCGLTVHRAVECIEFGQPASAEDAALLELAPEQPCAVVTRSAFDVGGRCIEWRVTWGDARAFQFTVQLT